MKRIVVDPLTRIEGHLRIEAALDDGAIKDAWSSSTMFRGIERILKGRDPRDAWLVTQRICGVCTTVHAIASIRSVEAAVGAQPPPNAVLLRNIIMASQMVQDHVIHFYHLHALDWVDVTSALKAEPQKAARMAQSLSDWPKSSAAYFRRVASRLQTFVDSGQLGPFRNGYWGHPGYALAPEANLVAVAHYLEALEWQREIIRVHAILGGKNPHLQTFLVGGMSTPMDADEQASLNAGTLAQIRAFLDKARVFVKDVYLPDLLAVASSYKDWANVGSGVGNYLCCGDYPDADGTSSVGFLPGGVIRGADLSAVDDFDERKVTEYVTRSWYRYTDGDDRSAHPYEGETIPHHTGPKPPYDYLDVDGKYSWLKAPRYDDLPMEVGPLARMLVAYARGHERVRKVVDHVLGALGVGPSALLSTLGRTAARGIETMVLSEKMNDWVEQLSDNLGRGEQRIHDNSRWDPSSWPRQCRGAGFHEAPRGMLGHWVQIEDEKIANYQCVVPTTWNAGPRDHKGNRGPCESALIGTPISDPQRPLEILRTIHSFDPCLACGVHIFDPSGRQLVEVKVR